MPAHAVPGYGYRVLAHGHQGSLCPLDLFQICTLKASKSTVSKGTAIRFSGVVPVEGRSGATAGTRTTVYMFAHKGTAGQPTNLDPTKQGWRYIGSFRTDGYGKYRTPLLKLCSTMSVVMQIRVTNETTRLYVAGQGDRQCGRALKIARRRRERRRGPELWKQPRPSPSSSRWMTG